MSKDNKCTPAGVAGSFVDGCVAGATTAFFRSSAPSSIGAGCAIGGVANAAKTAAECARGQITIPAQPSGQSAQWDHTRSTGHRF